MLTLRLTHGWDSGLVMSWGEGSRSEQVGETIPSCIAQQEQKLYKIVLFYFQHPNHSKYT